ncbi:hypothetical protein F3N42_09455 [Marinihelvus fidelis]|uniref:Uncharacterized protein n=1 Tax=Marinihelvus fidelis TaxID=2613842 RepID=A0A5N0T914_9GAMM|nr:hypothetical protein [Marinihelvus fidelis]KAA9131533.1 hypothetical protein F3N42_09455 [Marinihelvus fidelis]
MGQVNIRHEVLETTVDGNTVRVGALYKTKFSVKGKKGDSIKFRRTEKDSTNGFRVEFNKSPVATGETEWRSTDSHPPHTVDIDNVVNGEYEYKIFYEHEDEIGKVLPLDPVIIIGHISLKSLVASVIIAAVISLVLGYFAASVFG